jgi:hypothetical protein
VPGHGGAVLLKIYAHCVDGQADAANRRITDAFGTLHARAGPGDEGGAVARVAVRESAAFAGRPDQVGEARAFVGRLLGPSHPCGDVAVLLASEMVTNSLLHGGSGSGEAVTVTRISG